MSFLFQINRRCSIYNGVEQQHSFCTQHYPECMAGAVKKNNNTLYTVLIIYLNNSFMLFLNGVHKSF